LGELYGNDCLTLRTSIIGLELARCKSLVEWFLDQNGIVKGYTKAVYSGFTTIELARIIENLLIHHTDLSGLWHVASQPISKYELLMMLSSKIGRRDVKIEADSSQVCDRSLDASRFNNAVRYNPPTWDELLTELAEQIKTRK
jgi:dTDP-4-dehydrorhamnose reductase